MTAINQKEYLKKYLNIGNDKEKKKKKKKKITQNRLTIIDDNIDVVNTTEEFTANELDEFLTQEDAPQVVGVIDDRPPALRIDDYRKSSKWKLVGSDDEAKDANDINSTETRQKTVKQEPTEKRRNDSDSDYSPPRKSDYKSKNDDKRNERTSKLKIEFTQNKKYLDESNSRQKPSKHDRSPVRRHRDDLSPVRRRRDDSSPIRKYKEPDSRRDFSPKRSRRHSDSDTSPVRKSRREISPNQNKKQSDSDASPPRKSKKDSSPKQSKKYSDSDTSPPRKSRRDVSPRQNRKQDSDTSPPRKSKRDVSPKGSRKHLDVDENLSKKSLKKHSDSDGSPLRRSRWDLSSKQTKKHPGSDQSPLRKSRWDSSPKPYKKHPDSDTSPPRKSKSNSSPQYYKKHPDSDSSPPRKSKWESSPKQYQKHPDSDSSPPRKSKKNHSPPQSKNYSDLDKKSRRDQKYSDSDVSLPRKSQRDFIPKQFKKHPETTQKNYDSDSSPPPRSKPNSSTSTSKHTNRPRNTRWGDITPPIDETDHNKKEKNDTNLKISKESSKKMTKTLDGKIAGLQNAQDLKHETVAFKKREDELFKKMSEEASGANAAPVIRDRKTGRKRDFEKEAMEEFAKMKAEQEKKDKYNQWGKGLKQVEDLREKIASDVHEMNKPLARYADDEDLDKFLREQEREGDPMLQYIRKKRKKKDIDDGKPVKPMYQGEYMPNRFGIPPGYRWDGVDRSTGYEKQWFEKQNSRKAMEEEVYKWSTEDM